jgi:hypothetical protein
MADLPSRKFSARHVAVDAALTLAAFVLFYEIAKPHVMSNDRTYVGIWATFTAACMTGVFWLAWQMLKAVYRHQRAGKQSGD